MQLQADFIANWEMSKSFAPPKCVPLSLARCHYIMTCDCFTTAEAAQLVGRVGGCFWFASIARSSARLIFGGGTGISPNRNSLPGRLLSPSSSFCYSVRLISLGAGTFLISSLIASVAARTSWISLTRICINHAQMEIWSRRREPSKNDFCDSSHPHSEVWHHNFLWRTLSKNSIMYCTLLGNVNFS